MHGKLLFILEFRIVSYLDLTLADRVTDASAAPLIPVVSGFSEQEAAVNIKAETSTKDSSLFSLFILFLSEIHALILRSPVETAPYPHNIKSRRTIHRPA